MRTLAIYNAVHQYFPFPQPRWPLTAIVPAPFCPATMDLITRDPKYPGIGQIMMQPTRPCALISYLAQMDDLEFGKQASVNQEVLGVAPLS